MKKCCLPGGWPDKICQATQLQTLQEYSLISIDIERWTVGALLWPGAALQTLLLSINLISNS